LPPGSKVILLPLVLSKLGDVCVLVWEL